MTPVSRPSARPLVRRLALVMPLAWLPIVAPAQERAPAIGLDHESVLEDYASYEETDGPDWIEANRRVGEIGGWRTYARELFESGDDGEER